MLQVIQNYRTGVLEVVDVPVPTVRPGSLLIRTGASVVSAGTERHLVDMAQKSLLGKAMARPDLVRRVLGKMRTDGVAETLQQVQQRLDTPVPLGYSAAGTVMAVGEDVTGFGLGDPVACGGQGVALHAEVLCAPATLVTAVPPGVSLDEAALAMVGAISLHAIRLCRVQPGEWVAVIGLGLLGLLAVQMLRASGCRVVGLDIVPDKLATAKALGVETVADSGSPDVAAMIETETEGRGADAVLITAGTSSNTPLELAAGISRIRGRIVAVGLVGLEVPRGVFFERELELVVSRASGPGLYDPDYEVHGTDYPYPYVRWTHGRNMAEFLRLVATGAVKLDPLITDRFPISRAPDAYTVLQGEGGVHPIGILLEYPREETAGPSIVRIRDGTETHVPKGTIRVGLIGAGLFARTTLLPELRKVPGLHLAGVATASGSSAYHVARTFGFDYATADPQEILGDANIDCVIIATRHDSHARLVGAALRAGKDVFVEKPLALSVAEILDVAEAWRDNEVRLMVGFNRRHSSHTAALRGFLASVGGPILLHCRVNAGNVPARSWVNDPLLGGDRVRGEVCHFVDLAHYLLDDYALAAEAVGLPPKRADDPVEDLAAVLLFPDGSVANVVYTARGHRALARERIEVFREGRAAVIDNFRATRFYGLGAPRTYRTWRLDRGYRGELSVWFDALRKGRQAPVSFATYAASTLATLAVAEALVSRRRVDLDPEILGRCIRPR
ncbi:MAG: Gfo/Idh/MocA family oxidoreductase [Candidatus Methylomirabilales bacterium]